MIKISAKNRTNSQPILTAPAWTALFVYLPYEVWFSGCFRNILNTPFFFPFEPPLPLLARKAAVNVPPGSAMGMTDRLLITCEELPFGR